MASHHNVPGDRGVTRLDGWYTAPRLVPDLQTVQIWAESGDHQIFMEFGVRDPARPDPEVTARPGDLNPVFSIKEIKTSRPIDSGLRVGQSVGIIAFDRTGRPLL